MKRCHKIFKIITSSPHYNKVKSFSAPLKDQLGINHFWYYRITEAGFYTYLGSHAAWSEFCFDRGLLADFPCLRHPKTAQNKIQLMKAGADVGFQNVLQTAWDKFQINFNINLVKRIPEGVEAFGFATCINDPRVDERLINALPFLNRFIRAFRENHPKLFALLEENPVDLSQEIGSVFYKNPHALTFSDQQQALLAKLTGVFKAESLTPRQIEILKFIAHGYPASYIATQLKLSLRTVENYLATIKEKLGCASKVELIERARLFSEDSLFLF